MPDRLRNAIHEACEAIRGLPPTDATLKQMVDRGIERGKYDAALPIRERLAEVLRFLEPFERGHGLDKLADIPGPLVHSLAGEMESLKRIADEIPVKCQPQTTCVVPPSFHGAEAGIARNVEAIYGRIYSQLKSLVTTQAPIAPSDEEGSFGGRNVEVRTKGVSSGVPPSSGRPVVITLHGIRTAARWQKTLAEQLSKAGFIPVSFDYGWFSVLPFLFQRQRDKKIREFVDWYQSVRERYPSVVPSVIAHSLGTYIAARAISESSGVVKFEKIIFCGSIVPVAFPWSKVHEAGLVTEVLNDCGYLDAWAGRVGSCST